jgi:hypothetical protein
MLASERAVLIRYWLDENSYVGTGLRVNGPFVLTADHCAEGSHHRVVCDGVEHDATIWVRSYTHNVDLALLKVPSAPEVEPLGCGLVNRDIALWVDGCQALGFPRWKRSNGRVLAQVRGYIPTAEGRPADSRDEAGWLALKATDPAIADAHPIPEGSLEATGSPWAGMSGAAVITIADELVVGVVRSHNPAEGGGSLAITPLEAIEQLGPEVRSRMWAALGVDDPSALPVLPKASRIDTGALAMAGATFDPFAEELDLHKRDCLAHCPRLADGTLLLDGRAPDRARMAEIAFAGKRFCWVRAPMSAGKTAVAAWFTLAPPADTVALACFVGPTTDGDQFLDILLRRMSALVRYSSDVSVTLSEKPLLLAKLLEKAEDLHTEAGQHLVIVVDGLDEDPQSSGVTPIAQLLPRELPGHLHLVVFSRPNPGPLPFDHPLREASACYDLPPAEEARVEIERAQGELDRIAQQGSTIATSILTMLAVAGPLMETDLIDLLSPQIAREVALAFNGPLRRLTYAVGAGADQSHSFGHIALQQTWIDGLGNPAIEAATQQVDNWVDRYIEQGWPPTTPYYCLDGYVDMLVRRGEPIRLAAIAFDERRRSRLLTATGSRVTEATVIAKAQRSVSTMTTPDIKLATSLALESLIVRNSLEEAARPEMVGFDVRRGEVRKAIDTVMTLSPESDYWHSASVELVAALYLTGRDDIAEVVLQRLRSEHPDERLVGSVAQRVAIERPDLAIRLADSDGTALAGLARSLATHDAFRDQAIRSVQEEPELQLAVARALAPSQPQAALQAIEGFNGYWEWSAGSKLWRDSSFARVEVARAMTSVDAALDVLVAEKDGTDGEAALVARGVLLAGQDGGSEFAESLGDSISPATMLARFALGEEMTLLVDRAVAARPRWLRDDLDLLQRFDPVLATSPPVIRTDYARLLLSVRPVSTESPQKAGLVALTQLLVINELRDGDAERLAQNFKVAAIPSDDAFGAAARRIALVEPQRAVALALESGPTSTWTLRDVLRDIAARDLGLAVELTDTVDPQFSGTRSVILGAVGALVDPQNTEIIDELHRRIPPPESSGVVTTVLADIARRVAALLPDGDDRARQLLERFCSGTDPALEKLCRLERAISLIIAGNADTAMQLVATDDSAPSVNDRTREEWTVLVKYLPGALADDLLQHQVLPGAEGRERQWAICTLASLDPLAAIDHLLEGPPVPHTFATVMRLADETLKEDTAKDRIKIKVKRLIAAASADEALLLCWSASRASIAVSPGATPLRPEYELLESRLAGDNAQLIVDGCDEAGLEPALVLAAWVYDQPTRLVRAVEATIERFRHDETYFLIPKRVSTLVGAAADADIGATNAVIEDIDWRLAPAHQSELLRDDSYETVVKELAHRDREAAYQRADAIRDPSVAVRALAALAAAIASRPADERGPTLANVLTTAHQRGRWTIHFARNLVSELIWIGRVEPHAMVTLLAETSAWPAADSTWLFGPLFSLLRHDAHAASAAAEALIAGTLTRNVHRV